ncbi:tyrosine-type recombinase/integrase [Pontibacter akesuensis]|uniref:tyrosine-type recombinase/integrase n=1 Tax=Pontibacter akesuensis TaxID=388950 RepID=UPI00155F5591|nr:site-specific integrase [Pontibacter akesuensis]
MKEHFKEGKLTKGYDSKRFQIDNDHIDTIYKKVDNIIKDYYQKYSVTPEIDYVDSELKKADKERELSNKSLFEYFEKYIEEKKLTHPYNTVRNIEACKRNLEAFAEDTKYTITFESINYEFVNAYRVFSIKKKRQDVSIAHTMALLKSFLKYCNKCGYTNIKELPDLKIRHKKKNDDPIVLTEKEVSDLQGVEIQDKGKEYVRDLFVLMCATGLRFSDVIRINKAKIEFKKTEENRNFINTDITKTKDRVSIPLTDLADEVLIKYDYQTRPIDAGYFNKTIKEVCKQIESLKQEVQIIKYIGATPSAELKYKHDLISAHTGRRTFISNCVNAERPIPFSTIMKWTNHKKIEIFSRYINKSISEEQHISKVFKKVIPPIDK